MISLIKNDKGESLFKIKYYGVDNVLEYEFYTDPYSYGYALIAIAEELDVDIDKDRYADVDDKQYSFISDSSSFSDFHKLVNADHSLNLDKKIVYIQNHIDKFCNEWNMRYYVANAQNKNSVQNS